jgi:hypothetical protein
MALSKPARFPGSEYKHPDGDLRDYVEPEEWGPDGFCKRPIVGAIVELKDKREHVGDITKEQMRKLIAAGVFEYRPGKPFVSAWVEHNGRWQVGRVERAFIIGNVAYVEVRVDLRIRDGRFTYNLMRDGYTPAFSLGHVPAVGNELPKIVEVSFVGVPRRNEAYIVQHSNEGSHIRVSLFSTSDEPVVLPDNSPYGNGSESFDAFSIGSIRDALTPGARLSNMAAPVGKNGVDSQSGGGGSSGTGVTNVVLGGGGGGDGGKPGESEKKVDHTPQPQDVTGKRNASSLGGDGKGEQIGADALGGARGNKQPRGHDAASVHAGKKTEQMEDDTPAGGDADNKTKRPSAAAAAAAGAAPGAFGGFDESSLAKFIQSSVFAATRQMQQEHEEKMRAQAKAEAERRQREEAENDRTEWRAQMNEVWSKLQPQHKNPMGEMRRKAAMERFNRERQEMEGWHTYPKQVRQSALEYYRASAVDDVITDPPVGKPQVPGADGGWRQQNDYIQQQPSESDIINRFRPPMYGSYPQQQQQRDAFPAPAAAGQGARGFELGGAIDPNHEYLQWTTHQPAGVNIRLKQARYVEKFNASASGSNRFNAKAATRQQCAQVVATAFMALPDSVQDVHASRQQDGHIKLTNPNVLDEIGQSLGINLMPQIPHRQWY